MFSAELSTRWFLNSLQGDLLVAELSTMLTGCITCNVIEIYNGRNHELAECSIRVTVLLKYLDLTFATRSWLWNHNSVVCIPIVLYYCKDFLRCLFQLHTNFQLTALSGLPGRRELLLLFLFTNLDRAIITHLWFHVIFP